MHTIHATILSLFCWAAALAAGLFVALPAAADGAGTPAADNGQSTQVAEVRQAPPPNSKQVKATIINITAAQAARAARHEYGGKVLGVQLKQNDNDGPFYRVRLISRGRIHVVSINAHK